MKGFIYLIRNLINGKGYVGQTVSPIRKRFASHRFEALSNSETALHRSIRKYGFDNFSSGGDSAPRTERSISHCIALSVAHKGRILSQSHRKNISNGMMGTKRKPLTDEIKARISAGRKGQKCTPEVRARMSLQRKGNSYRKGILHSDETKARISATMKAIRAAQKVGK